MTESPCVEMCELDAAHNCRGCERTLSEIAEWGILSLSSRRKILDDLPRRRTARAENR